MPVILLSKSEATTPWGFRLHGGKDFGGPLVVQRINPGSIAAKCGLQIGDVIMQIDKTSTSDIKHKDAQDLIVKAGNNIELTIIRDGEVYISPEISKFPDNTNSNKAIMSNTSGFSMSSGATYGSTVDKPHANTSLDTSYMSNKKYEMDSRTTWEAPPPNARLLPVSGLNPGNVGEMKPYIPSETCKMVRDMDAGNELSYNPLTGAERRPAPVQSKLVDYIEKKCGELSVTNDAKGSNQAPPGPSAPFNRAPANTAAAPHNRAPASFVLPNTQDPANNGRAPAGFVLPSTQAPANNGRAPAGFVLPSTQAPANNGRSPASGAYPGGFRNAAGGYENKRPSLAGLGMQLEQAKNMPANTISDKIPVCNVDGLPIKGPYVTAVNKVWCQDHFVCSNPNCQRSLVDSGFVEEDGHLFCQQDYETYFAPRCEKCDQPIIGDTVKALQKAFHPKCFTCHQCKQPIMGGLFHLEQGEPYCEKDWAALYQTKCFGCQFPIELGDTWIEALGQNWHAECFNCTTCHVNLEGQGFVNRSGKPYCKDHASSGRV